MPLDQFTLPEKRIADLINKSPVNDDNTEHKPGLRKASVLLPLYLEEEWKLLFIRRTETVMDHKGQVAFPGGSAEEEDRDVFVTALREAYEEIGLPDTSVRILGRLQKMLTITGYLLTPVIGIIDWPFEIKIQEDEVSRVFSIPIQWLANSANFEIRTMAFQDGISYPVYFYKPFSGETLWGISARITVELLRTLGLINKNSAAS